MPQNKYSKILHYLAMNGEATKEQLYQNSEYAYYCNWKKHFGEVLKIMVKKRLIKKVGSLYALNERAANITAKNTSQNDPNQGKLF